MYKPIKRFSHFSSVIRIKALKFATLVNQNVLNQKQLFRSSFMFDL